MTTTAQNTGSVFGPGGVGEAVAYFGEFFKTRTGPGQAPGLFSQYPVRREWFRPKSKRAYW
eukprot:UN01043